MQPVEFRSSNAGLMLGLTNDKLEHVRTIHFIGGVYYAMTEIEANIMMKHPSYGRSFHRIGDGISIASAPLTPQVQVVHDALPMPLSPEEAKKKAEAEFKATYGAVAQEFEPPAQQISVPTGDPVPKVLTEEQKTELAAPTADVVKEAKPKRQPRTRSTQ